MKRAKVYFYFLWEDDFLVFPSFYRQKLAWKDKYDSPRCEIVPTFKVRWLWFLFCWTFGDDQYWEQWLWVHKYNDGNYEKAKSSWGWVDSKTKQSTWIDY